MELFRGGFPGGCGRFMMKARIVDVCGGLPSQLAGILGIAVLQVLFVLCSITHSFLQATKVLWKETWWSCTCFVDIMVVGVSFWAEDVFFPVLAQ